MDMLLIFVRSFKVLFYSDQQISLEAISAPGHAE